jgi:hypothetical protein
LDEWSDNTGMGGTMSKREFENLIGVPVSEAKAILIAQGIEPNSVL